MDTPQKTREEGRTRPASQGKGTPQRCHPQEEPRKTKEARPAPKQKAQQAPARRKAPPSGTAQRRRQPENQDVPERRRAYGNSKPKKKNTLQKAVEGAQKLRQQAAEDPKAKARQAARRKKRQQARKQMEAPAVIYTQPKAFNRDKLIIQITTVAAVVLAVILGLSVFFKVKVITVSGAEVYSSWAVREASGISEGENLLTFSKIRAASQIKAKLPYVEKVRIGIKLPDTVNIMVKEASVVYAIRDAEGTWWLMDSEGRVIESSRAVSTMLFTE